MASSSMPLLDDQNNSQDDDWTRMKDPKQRKKIQNRLAQRSYRKYRPISLDVHFRPMRLRNETTNCISMIVIETICLPSIPDTCTTQLKAND